MGKCLQKLTSVPEPLNQSFANPACELCMYVFTSYHIFSVFRASLDDAEADIELLESKLERVSTGVRRGREGAAELNIIWETLTNLLCVARKYLDELADLVMTICMS